MTQRSLSLLINLLLVSVQRNCEPLQNTVGNYCIHYNQYMYMYQQCVCVCGVVCVGGDCVCGGGECVCVGGGVSVCVVCVVWCVCVVCVCVHGVCACVRACVQHLSFSLVCSWWPTHFK